MPAHNPRTMQSSNSYLCPASELKEGMYIINPRNGVCDFAKIIFIQNDKPFKGWLTAYTKENGKLDAGAENWFNKNEFVEVLNAST